MLLDNLIAIYFIFLWLSLDGKTIHVQNASYSDDELFVLQIMQCHLVFYTT